VCQQQHEQGYIQPHNQRIDYWRWSLVFTTDYSIHFIATLPLRPWKGHLILTPATKKSRSNQKPVYYVMHPY
jgi:hypothetical protein